MSISPELQAIIDSSTFAIQPGVYVYGKLARLPADKHFLIAQDSDEITIITTVEKLESLDFIERNKEDYSLIALEVSLPFYATGFLAAVSQAIALREMNILIVSTYSKDYILVKQSKMDEAKAALLELGFKEKQ